MKSTNTAVARLLDLKDADLAKPIDELVETIVQLSKSLQALRSSRLKQDTIILLLQDMTKLSKRDIKLVLDALPQLEKRYLK